MSEKKVIKLVVKKKQAKSKSLNADCINLLKQALADARQGKIQAVFLVGTGPNTTGDGGTGDMIFSGWSPPDSVFSMLGGIENAKIEFANKEIEHR